MSRNDKKKIRFSGVIKTIIYGRTAIILLGFLAQLILMAVGYVMLRNYSFLFYILFLIISAVAVIDIYNDRSNPDLKLSWMFPIALFPVFGAIFYVTIASGTGTRKLYARIRCQAEIMKTYLHKDEAVAETLKRENPQMASLANYLEHYDNSPVYGNTTAEYFPLGDDQFVAMKEELKKAEKFIFMEFFIVSEGRMHDDILEILREKAKQGVEVRFMCDGTNVLLNLPSYYPLMLKEDGIKCKFFSPIKVFFSPHYNNRDHRKILVIDGKVAFTGGINLADEYINEKVRFGHWKDTGIMIKGDAVERFTYMFLEMWNESGAEKRESFEQYRTPMASECENAVEAKQTGECQDAVEAVGNDGYVIPYSVCPLGAERVGERVYLDVIDTAYKYVHIMTPYLILDYQMIMSLTYAAKRGVEVVIIMPHIPDKKYAFVLAKTYYNQLIEAGVKIYEYEPGFVHAKVMVADGYKAVVGTVNLDYRSLYHHFECGVILYQNSEIAVIEQDVQNTLEKCIEIHVEDYKKQKITDRILGWIMRLIAPMM